MAHGCHGVSNHRHIDSVISNLFVLTIKNPPKLYCSFVRGNRPVPCGFPSQRASYSDSVSMSWWRRPRIDFPVTTSWQRRKYTTTPPMRHIEWLTTWAQCCYLLRWDTPDIRRPAYVISMMTSSNGNIFRVTGRCAGNSPVTAEFPVQRPVTRSFDVSFDLSLSKRLSKPSWGWLFETPTGSLWRHCNTHWRFIYLVRVVQ